MTINFFGNELAGAVVAPPVNIKVVTLTRRQALRQLALKKNELAQSACCAFDAYNSPKPKSAVAAPSASREPTKAPVAAPWREESNTRYTGFCFVTILDDSFLNNVFKLGGGGLLEVKLDAPGVPQSADLYAILSVEKVDSTTPDSENGGDPKPSVADQAFVPLPYNGYTQFLIRKPDNAQLRIQLYDKVPQLGDHGLVERVAPLPGTPADWRADGGEGASNQQVFATVYKDEKGASHPVNVSASWRLVPFEACSPDGEVFRDRPALQDIKKEYLKMKLGASTPLKERVVASLVDGVLPYASQIWAKVIGTDAPGAKDTFADLRGTEPPLQDLAFIDSPGTDTQVWLQHDGNGKVVVSFRGTDKEKLFEWLLDLCGHPEVPTEVLAVKADPAIDAVLVHAGFDFAYANVRSAVKTLIKEYYQELTRLKPHVTKTVVITGHSQGGGLATLAAYDMARQAAMRHSEKFYDELRAYTFASPRVGNLAFMREYNELVPDTWRIHNPRDIVARVPNSWDFVDAEGRTRQAEYFHVGANIQLGQVPDSASDLPVKGAEGEEVSRQPVNWVMLLGSAIATFAKRRAAGVLAMPEVAEHTGNFYAPSVKQLVDELGRV